MCSALRSLYTQPFIDEGDYLCLSVIENEELMAERLYPNRQRCKACSKKLGDTVLDGKYCSYSCGSLPQPMQDIDNAPRQCKMERNKIWLWKQKYRSEEEVPKRFQNDPTTNIYRCSNCRYLHIGHSRAIGNENARLVFDNKTLRTVLEKTRESRNQTRKDVAAKLKTRPIRIKEIEEGSESIDAKILFLLIKHYKMKMNLLF